MTLRAMMLNYLVSHWGSILTGTSALFYMIAGAAINAMRKPDDESPTDTKEERLEKRKYKYRFDFLHLLPLPTIQHSAKT